MCLYKNVCESLRKGAYMCEIVKDVCETVCECM